MNGTAHNDCKFGADISMIISNVLLYLDRNNDRSGIQPGPCSHWKPVENNALLVLLHAERPGRSVHWVRFLSFARSKLRLCSANHRPGYWSNLTCDCPSTVWAYSEKETENGPWFHQRCSHTRDHDKRLTQPTARITTYTVSFFPSMTGWGAVSDLSLFFHLSQKCIHGLWRLKSKLKSEKHLITNNIQAIQANEAGNCCPGTHRLKLSYTEAVPEREQRSGSSTLNRVECVKQDI